MCTLCYVDDAMKKKIAAYGASFRKATTSPFGSADEIGMLNLVTAESRDAILSTADAGKMIDLSVDYFVGMPSWVGANDPNYQLWMTHTPAGEKITNSVGVTPELNDLVSYSSDAVSMYTHCGTHIDALNHFGYHGVIFNNYKAADHIGSRHWDVAGANKLPPIVARGVLLDVAGLPGRDAALDCASDRKTSKKCLEHQKTPVPAGRRRDGADRPDAGVRPMSPLHRLIRLAYQSGRRRSPSPRPAPSSWALHVLPRANADRRPRSLAGSSHFLLAEAGVPDRGNRRP